MIILKAIGIFILFVFIMWVVLPTIWFCLLLIFIVVTCALFFAKIKSFKAEPKIQNSVNVIDTLSLLPTPSKLLGMLQYSYLKKELIWLSSEDRNIQQMRSNNLHAITDIDTTISSKISISNARAQAHANATAYAPLTNKEVQKPDLGTDVNIDDLNSQKVKIRKEFTEKINGYNTRVDNLIFWRNAMFRDWYLDQLGFPNTSCFPKHIIDGISQQLK